MKAEAATDLGAVGTVRGTALTAGDHGPRPTMLRAATLNQYRVPLLNPVTVYHVAVEVPSLTPTQPVAPFGERWIT